MGDEGKQNPPNNKPLVVTTNKSPSPVSGSRQSKEMNLRRQLALYLDMRSMTLPELARKSGVSRHTLFGWAQGQKPRDIAQLHKVASVLQTTVDHLCFGDGADDQSRRVTELDALVGDGWVGGLFEVKFRRVKRGA